MEISPETTKKWLKDNKRSQLWLAEKLGCHAVTLNRWLKGKQSLGAPRVMLLKKIMGYGVSLPPPQNFEVPLRLPDEIWRLVEQLAVVQGLSTEEYIQHCTAQVARELALLLLKANER